MSNIDLKALRDAAEHAKKTQCAGVGIDTLHVIDLLDRLESAERRAEEAEKERDALQAKATRAALLAPFHEHRKAALEEWMDKTEFIQEWIASGRLPVKYLGWHRADVLRDLVAELDALRKDAERYRFLARVGLLHSEFFEDGRSGWAVYRRDADAHVIAAFNGDDLGAAIDAAMAQEGGK